MQTDNITLQHMTHFITQMHHTNPNRDVPNEFCVLRNKSDRVTEHPTPHTRAVALGLYQGRCCVVSLCSARELLQHVSQFSWDKIVEPSTTCGTAVLFVCLNSDAVFDTEFQ